MSANEPPIPEPPAHNRPVASSQEREPTGSPHVGGTPGDVRFGPLPPPSWATTPNQWPPGPDQWPPGPTAPQMTPPRKSPRLFASRATGWIVAAVLACAVVALSIVVATTPSTTTTSPAARVPTGGLTPGSGPFAGRFGSGSGGAVGTVDSVSASSFTMTTRAGQQMTVDEQSSTTYRSSTGSASASAVTDGARVLVVGSTSGSTIRATQVIVLPAGGGSFGFPGASTS